MPARILTIENVPAFVSSVQSADRVAVDTEFHAERRYVPTLYLVQVYVPGEEAWVIDPLVPDLLTAVATVLRSVPWIVHGGGQDIRLLAHALGGVPDTIWDTQIGSGLLCERFPEGYASLVSRYLGLHLPKGATLSDWSVRPLTEEQLTYAVDDVLRLPDLWRAIEAKLTASGRLDVAREACQEARLRHMTEPDPQSAWLHFSAAEGMRWQARAILRELAAWRESLAQAHNQPVRSVLGDGTVIELAKRPPGTKAGIQANRRFPRSAQKHIDAIWSAIERGRRCSASDAPMLPERYSRPWRDLQVWQAWRTMLSHRYQASARLMLDDRRLHSLVLTPPSSRAELSSQLGAWRDQLYGEEAWRWMQGDVCVVLDAGRGRLRDVPGPA